jgi:hypothetical protein
MNSSNFISHPTAHGNLLQSIITPVDLESIGNNLRLDYRSPEDRQNSHLNDFGIKNIHCRSIFESQKVSSRRMEEPECDHTDF